MTEHCCEMMGYYVQHEDRVVYFVEELCEYLVPVHDWGSARSGILLRFCPWCGKRLPNSRRDEVFGEDSSLLERWELLPEQPIADLDDWMADVQSEQPFTISRMVRVTGSWNKRVGQRLERADIEVTAEPARYWAVEVDLPDQERLQLERLGYLRWAVLGMLDVLVTAHDRPVLDILLRITGAKAGPGLSNRHAFRMAGRRAAYSLLRGASPQSLPRRPSISHQGSKQEVDTSLLESQPQSRAETGAECMETAGESTLDDFGEFDVGGGMPGRRLIP